MSTLVQPFPSSSFYSGHDQVFVPSQYLAAFDYVRLSSVPQQLYYSTLIPAHSPPAQGQRQSLSPNLRRTSSNSNWQGAPLAYVSDQQEQHSQRQDGQQVPVLTSQITSIAPTVFHNPNHDAQTSEAFASQSQMQYYPLQNSMAHISESSGQAFHPQESVFAPSVLRSNTQQSAVSSVGKSIINPLLPTPAPLESSREEYRGSVAKPKPQCFEHGCNGREFSTFSNLLRHQRERSGNATKSTCPHCGIEFTRTTARNGHLTNGKCRSKARTVATAVAIR